MSEKVDGFLGFIGIERYGYNKKDVDTQMQKILSAYYETLVENEELKKQNEILRQN